MAKRMGAFELALVLDMTGCYCVRTTGEIIVTSGGDGVAFGVGSAHQLDQDRDIVILIELYSGKTASALTPNVAPSLRSIAWAPTAQRADWAMRRSSA